MIVKSLRVDRDNARQLIWFSGLLDDGHRFSVGFPIAHIQVTFDENAASMGWVGEPICGSVVSIDGYFATVKAVTGASSPARKIAQRAHDITMSTMATHANAYGRSAVSHLKANALRSRPRPSHVLPAVGAKALAAYHTAHILGSQAKQGTIHPRVGERIRSLAANPTNPTSAIMLAALHSVRP